MTRMEMTAYFDDPAFAETTAEFAALGKANAEEALDQVAKYDGIEDAVSSYAENLGDTLRGYGLDDGDARVIVAVRAFNAVLDAKGVSFRPVGFANA